MLGTKLCHCNGLTSDSPQKKRLEAVTAHPRVEKTLAALKVLEKKRCRIRAGGAGGGGVGARRHRKTRGDQKYGPGPCGIHSDTVGRVGFRR